VVWYNNYVDVLDERILQLVSENKSIHEMRDDVNLSTGEVHNRLVHMQEAGLILPPPKPHMARARKLTEWGKSYLQSAGYARMKLFQE
jgi:hypothetical protein